MRRILGISLLVIGVALCAALFLADPYTSWGVEHEQVRPAVATVSRAFALVGLLVLGFAAVPVFWRRQGQLGVVAIFFVAATVFFFVTAAARVIWVSFWVLA